MLGGADAHLAIETSSLGLYLQTKTFSGASVLGIMIHGATLNTTVSVKIGDRGIPWRMQAEIRDLPLPIYHCPPKYLILSSF